MIFRCNIILGIKFRYMSSTTNQGLFAAMVARKLKFGLGDGGLVQVGLFVEGSGGLEPPASASGKS